MTSAEASSVGTNSAVAIELVMRNTPAFEADVMDGDFLLEIDGLKIPDVPTFLSTIDAKRGQTIRVLLSRRGTRLTKSIRTNP
jgi:C-terminal processing protease CtpA/Prc